jgi:IgA Peptidase M64/CARDB
MPLHRRMRDQRWAFSALVALLMWFAVSDASAEPVITIRANGDPANRVDIVVLGDGYTAADLAQYDADVETLVRGFFAQEPFSEYQRYFNVHRIDVTSIDSGADHPERNPPVLKNTALDSTYNCAGIQRLICADLSKVNAVLAASVSANMRDVVLVVVNDPEYGGSGGAIGVVSVHPEVVELALHELGHSFGLLADEYGGPPPPFCDSAVEPAEANATKETVREFLKWANWVAPETPIPTPGPTVGMPGNYQGAKYCDTDLYRPTFNSKMRALGVPFEQVNSEQLVKRVYNLASPLDGVEPELTSVTLKQGESMTFRVRTPQPLTHALDVVWNVAGQAVATGEEFTLSTSTLAAGSYTVEAVASDPTSLVRNDPAAVLKDTRRWDLIVTVVTSLPDFVQVAVSDPPAMLRAGRRFTVNDTVRNDGAAATELSTTRFFLSLDARRNAGDRRLIGTRPVPALVAGEESAGTTTVRIPPTVVPGAYFLLACADRTRVSAESNERNNCLASATQIIVLP